MTAVEHLHEMQDQADFEPIDLEDLIQGAELLTRVDRKYLIAQTTLDELLRDQAGAFQILTIDGQNCFSYESVYFDTYELTSFQGAATGRRSRFKVRTRKYLDSKIGFLEVKTRGPRSTTVKQRREHPFGQSTSLGDSVGFVEAALAGRATADLLHPLLRTSYTRRTLANITRCERVTIDQNICSELVNLPRSVAPVGLVVIETKSSGPATAVDRWFWRRGIRPARISKFATTLAMIEPSLPSNRWHRTIRDLKAFSSAPGNGAAHPL